MKGFILWAILLAIQHSLHSQQDSDIYIMDINLSGASPDVRNAVNITNRPGNDKDPVFSLNGRDVIYSRTSFGGESDIYSYNIKKKTHTQLTFTREQETNPTYSFNNKELTVIIEDDAGDKHLGLLPPDGGQAQAILDLIDPISGYVWCGEYLVAVYSEIENSLHVANILTNGSERSMIGKFSNYMQYIPFDNSLYYIDQTTANWFLKKLHLNDGRVQSVVEVVTSSDFFFITEGGAILLGDGYSLYLRNAEVDRWQFVINLLEFGIIKYNHLALSPDQRKIAVVSVQAAE